MRIIDLAHVIAADVRDQITWFQGKHLLSVNPSCVSCNTSYRSVVIRQI